MKKIGWFICILVFVFVSVFVISLDNTTPTKRVKFTNQSFEIKNEGNEIANNNSVKIKLSDTEIKDKKLTTNNKDIKVNTIDNIENSSKKTTFNNVETDYENSSVKVDNQGALKFKNLDDSALDVALNDAKNIKNKAIQTPERQRYAYKNIDWNTWKSNFVNQILEDSLSIRELDSYNDGAWLYYSFDVDSVGRVYNISVKSPFLTTEDKDKVAKLIRSYQYKEITVFPANTKRKTAKVSAVMLLSTETLKSKPSDFNDFEHVKMKL